MKKKYLKVLAVAAALVLLGSLGWFANAFLGNPISRYLASRAAKAYLEKNYAGTDYKIEDVGYSFKDGSYYANVHSPGSEDGSFSISLSMKGEVKYDDYEFYVERRMNTAMRLDAAYRERTDAYFESPDFPYESDIAFGTLEFREREMEPPTDPMEGSYYALVQEDLVLDQQYDIAALGAAAGHLTIHIDSETVTEEEAARMMLEIRAGMDKQGVPFRVMDFHLQQPEQRESGIDILCFPYEKIYAQDMVTRVSQANKAAKEYFARMDQEKGQSAKGYAP